MKFISVLCLTLLSLPLTTAHAETAPLTVFPTEIKLQGAHSHQHLVVDQAEGSFIADRTHEAKIESLTPEICLVEGNIVSPVGNGTGKIRISLGDQQQELEVIVSGVGEVQPIDFHRDIVPILTRYGCNSGPCHGKSRGQNGFQLSLLGFDSAFDYNALTKEARGRRLFPPVPEESLLIQKGAAQVPHGGGKKLTPDSPEYNMLLRWIASGTPEKQPETPKLEKVTVYPPARIMQNEKEQQLVVTAHYSDGTKTDVTRLTQYQSNEAAIADIDETGLIASGTVTGKAAVMARYQNMIAVCTVSVPLPGEVDEQIYEQLPEYNFIDGLVWKNLKELKLLPSEPAPDHTFLRRAYLDIIGRAPTAEEARAFLTDTSDDKRVRLIDHLLEQPEYAEFWSTKWADLLRPNPYRVGIKAVMNYDAWIRESFRENKPYDQFAHELITAQGSTFRNGAVTLYRDRRTPDEITTMVGQLFLGIRLDCARCHHHPFEIWGQEDFYSFAAYFAQIKHKGTGLSPPISGSEEMIFDGPGGEVKHPLTNEVLAPKPLFGEAPEINEETSRREALAIWMTSKENPFFSQTMANRVWADLMGRGMVEPVDDLRGTNPAVNQELLTALGEDFAAHDFNIKQLIRRICTSYVYGLSSHPVERNMVDTRNYSRYYRQRLRAEVLFDSIIQVTGAKESFQAMPAGVSSKELWTTRIDSLFLDAFGRPDPNQDPPCERTTDTTIVQALHLMNSEELYKKVTGENGNAAKLIASDKTNEEIIDELYLSIYSRFPDAEERAAALALYNVDGTNRKVVTEDLMWAMLNTPEFVFKD
ncbi:MAG: DUF1549 domain-containing protein [Planctomycetaceae bacterium]|nr:DUF1549 domain-containing protein [Planctomycetaceae bacterium]